MAKPMDGMNDMGAGPVAGGSSAADPSGGGDAADDLSQGYVIEVSVLPDGTFQVSPPEPLSEEAKEENADAGEEPGSEKGDTYEIIAEALKGIIKVVKANPVGGADAGQAQFDAGYNA